MDVVASPAVAGCVTAQLLAKTSLCCANADRSGTRLALADASGGGAPGAGPSVGPSSSLSVVREHSR